MSYNGCMAANQPNSELISAESLAAMSEAAWRTREHAHIVGRTRVGCAALAASGAIYPGCNVEHRFRCHDVHAEVNAMTAMVAAGERFLVAIMVVAERDFFMPCGGCIDWIMELGSGEVLVIFQNVEGGPLESRFAKELMPYYPA